MTEEDWLCCGDPEVMLQFLGEQAGERKLRLMCLSEVCPESQGWALAEGLAEGTASDADRETHFLSEANDDATAWLGRPDPFTVREAMAILRTIVGRATYSLTTFHEVTVARRVERARIANLVREVFGNPFGLNSILPVWLQWHAGIVWSIAQSIYERRQFQDCPIVADALEDAGCDNADLLNHLRGPGPHVRGCWALDLLLGRE